MKNWGDCSPQPEILGRIPVKDVSGDNGGLPSCLSDPESESVAREGSYCRGAELFRSFSLLLGIPIVACSGVFIGENAHWVQVPDLHLQ
jgi:hypothetical protein